MKKLVVLQNRLIQDQQYLACSNHLIKFDIHYQADPLTTSLVIDYTLYFVTKTVSQDNKHYNC